MTDRTALETADDWRNDPIKVANCYNTPKYAAILLRQQHAEIERLTADLAESRRKSAGNAGRRS